MPTKRRGKVKITETIENNLIEESSSQKSFLPITLPKSRRVILIVAVLLLLAILFYLRSWFVVATVNGQPIMRLSLIQELEKRGGQQTLDSLITKTLILQEAKKQNVDADKKEIDAEIAKVEDSLTKQGQTLDNVLAIQGLTRDSLSEQIKIEKLIEKMIGRDVQVSDSEVDDYILKNSDSLPQSTDAAQLKQSIQQQLKQQKTSEKFQTWLAELQKQAKINYFLQY